MRASIPGIDHVVIAVRDLDHARTVYSRLGFTLTPRGVHTLGSQNHCIMFERDYIELLAPPRAHPAMQYYADFIARGDGLAAIALATEDADGVHAALRASGIEAEAPLDFARPVALPEGARDAAFRIVQLPVAQTPGCRTFLCQHFTRDVVWRPEYQRHALGATALAGIAVIVEDPARAAPSYAALFDVRPQRIDEGLRVDTGSAPIALAARGKLGRRLAGVELPARARPFVAALFIRVADRLAAAETLRRGGLEPVALKDGAYAVHAHDACGVTLVFG
ncbi:MAG: VOC family protein [Burkholderiales bacterium]|nr:VOC family protein [Burkholderiales bacterium]